MFADEMQNAIPVQFAACSVDDVNDVGTVKALTASDEKLGSDQFLGGKNLDGNAEDFGAAGMVDPLVPHGNGRVAHAGDEVHEVVPAMGFVEPHGSATVVSKPAEQSAARAQGTSDWARKRSRSLVSRQIPVC